MSTGPHTAFFYGTLMAPEILSRVCHGASGLPPNPSHGRVHIRTALLQGYRRHRVKHADYPAIVPCEKSTVRGALVSGLSDGDLERLDIFEGSEYERRKVSARELKYEGDMSVEPTADQIGESVEADTYVWISPKSRLEEDEWDFEEFVKEKMWAWTGGAGNYRSDYTDVDEAFEELEAGPKDPTGGRGLNGSISKALEEGRVKEDDIMKDAV